VGCTLSFEFITIIERLGQWIVSHRLEVQFSKILANTTKYILAKPFENDLKMNINHKHNRYFDLIPFFNGQYFTMKEFSNLPKQKTMFGY